MNQLAPIVPSKGDVFRSLNASLPLNEFHLPDHIYRADLVPQDILQLSARDRSQILDAASLTLTFDHGYPALNETTPFWEQLPCESPDQYTAFMIYLELPDKTDNINPIRMLPLIAEASGVSLQKLTEWAHIYYWHWRGRAYDLFLVACHRKQREQRIMSIEGAHFTESKKMLDKVIRVANAKLDNEIHELTSDPTASTESKLKDLIDMASKLVGIQRISLGLPANGVTPVQLHLSEPRNATVSDTYKHIAKEGQSDSTPSQRPQDMDALLSNQEDLDKVQEMMIRLNAPTHTLPAWGSGKVVNLEEDNEETQTPSEDGVEDLGNPPNDDEY